MEQAEFCYPDFCGTEESRLESYTAQTLTRAITGFSQRNYRREGSRAVDLRLLVGKPEVGEVEDGAKREEAVIIPTPHM